MAFGFNEQLWEESRRLGFLIEICGTAILASVLSYGQKEDNPGIEEMVAHLEYCALQGSL